LILHDATALRAISAMSPLLGSAGTPLASNR
jgi:hypothetical protein